MNKKSKRRKIEKDFFGSDEIKEAINKIQDKPQKDYKSKTAKGKIKVSTMMDENLRNRLRILAIKEKRKFTDLLHDSIQNYLSENER